MDLLLDLLSIIVLALALLAPYALIIVLARDIWRLIRPQRRLFQGRYGDARIAAERLEKSWMRILPSVRHSSRYTIALALHLEGRLDDALAILAALREQKLDPNLRYAVLSLEAGSLVLAGRDGPRAVEAIEEARAIRETREDMLITALALLDAGRADDAQKDFERSESMREPARTKLGRTVLFTIPKLKETIEATLRALFLVRAGRAAEAKADLETAAKSPHLNVYVERARLLVPPAVADDVDAPASLAPHVID